MRLTKKQVARIAALLEHTDAHSVTVEKLRDCSDKATCAVRVSFVGPSELPPVDVAISGLVRISHDHPARAALYPEVHS